jgi:hypothetical protein
MNTIDHGEGLKTKLIAWKAKMDDFIQKVAIRYGPLPNLDKEHKNRRLNYATDNGCS